MIHAIVSGAPIRSLASLGVLLAGLRVCSRAQLYWCLFACLVSAVVMKLNWALIIQWVSMLKALTTVHPIRTISLTLLLAQTMRPPIMWAILAQQTLVISSSPAK